MRLFIAVLMVLAFGAFGATTARAEHVDWSQYLESPSARATKTAPKPTAKKTKVAAAKPKPKKAKAKRRRR